MYRLRAPRPIAIVCAATLLLGVGCAEDGTAPLFGEEPAAGTTERVHGEFPLDSSASAEDARLSDTTPAQATGGLETAPRPAAATGPAAVPGRATAVEPVSPPAPAKDSVPTPDAGPEPDVRPAPPIFDAVGDREVPLGSIVEFRVTARADDGAPLRLTLNSAPDGAELTSADDGAHLFRWQPDVDDAGETLVTFAATREDDRDVRTTTTVALDVVRHSRFGGGRPLRDLAARHALRIGNAAPSDMFTFDDADVFGPILSEEYDIVTPENAMKMVDVHPERGRYRWEASDRIVEFAESRGLVVHGHPLVWKEQIPPWARELEQPERIEAMHEHIAALVSRYRGRIAVWDVVNEALETDGSWRHTLWYRAGGEDYLADAFRTARAHDPDAALIYNDYSIVRENAKSDALHAMLVRELARGTPIDGVGFQMHLRTHPKGNLHMDEMRRNLTRFAELGLDIYITELDIAVDWQRDPEEEAALQADLYADALRLCLEQPRCRAFQIWGLSDRHSWRSSLEPTPLDADLLPKPAFQALRDVLISTPVTAGREPLGTSDR